MRTFLLLYPTLRKLPRHVFLRRFLSTCFTGVFSCCRFFFDDTSCSNCFYFYFLVYFISFLPARATAAYLRTVSPGPTRAKKTCLCSPSNSPGVRSFVMCFLFSPPPQVLFRGSSNYGESPCFSIGRGAREGEREKKRKGPRPATRGPTFVPHIVKNVGSVPKEPRWERVVLFRWFRHGTIGAAFTPTVRPEIDQ